mmetsp:Transcript_69581/g.159880  ORF Transcript_69581/g.159880 Transcript_69581/m.159880 type:complete len:365 (-) Transcript_69581:158-1252(-)
MPLIQGEKAGKSEPQIMGEWLASVAPRGVDPTQLGAFFTKKAAMEVYTVFVNSLDWVDKFVVDALRELFELFKPGGESQVFDRILEEFSKAYFAQNCQNGEFRVGEASYKSADTIHSLTFSIIMLNTDQHAMRRRARKGQEVRVMDFPAYAKNAQQAIPEEIPESIFQQIFDDIKANEIALDPQRRAPYKELAVRPAMEGWLSVFVSKRSQYLRFWAALIVAVGRIYLFADEDDVQPVLAISLRGGRVSSDPDVLRRELLGKAGCSTACMTTPREDPMFLESAFLLQPNAGSILISHQDLAPRESLTGTGPSTGPDEADTGESMEAARKAEILALTGFSRLILVAETREYMTKWREYVDDATAM